MKKNIKMKKECKKIKRKGFTLVEILGVIVVIGLLSIIIAPNLINQLNKHKQEVADLQRKSLSDSAEEYFTKTDINYGKISNKTYCVSLKTLQENNYVESDLVNVLTGKKYDVEKTYIVGKAGNNPKSIDYSVNENGSCGDTFTICTITKSSDNKINYIGKNGSIVTQEQFLNECHFDNGITITSSPEGWAKQKEVKIIYKGNLTNINYNFEGTNIIESKINSDQTIITGIINKNQIISASATRILENNNQEQVMNTYNETKIDNNKPECNFTYDGKYDKETNWFGSYPTIKLNGTDIESPISRIYIIHNNKKDPEKRNTKQKTYTLTKKITQDTTNGGTYSGYVSDSAGNIKTCKTMNPVRIDTKAPSLSLEITNKTTRKITVKATASAVSGIKKYEYSINNGSWQSSTNNTYTFDNLNYNTDHTIKVRVTSNSTLTTEKTISAKTNNISAPSCSTSQNIIKVSYPSGCSSLTCLYNKDNKDNYVNGTTNVTFNSNGYLVAKTTDGYNTVSSACTFDRYRNIYQGYVKGGDIGLYRTSQYIGASVGFSTSNWGGFSYQGSNIVCNNNVVTNTGSTSFNVPDCNGNIYVYPNWKHDDYVWTKRVYKGTSYAFSLIDYDSVHTPGQFFRIYGNINENGIYMRTGVNTGGGKDADFKGTKYDGDNVSSRDSRNIYSSNDKVSLTDYATWVTTFDCYRYDQSTNYKAIGYPVYPTDHANGIAIFRTVSGIQNNWAETNNSAYCNGTAGSGVCGHAEMPLSNYNGSFYMNIQILSHVKHWCGWMDNYLLGKTYSYYDRAR